MTKSSDATGLEDSMNKYEWQTSLRTYLPSCAECVFRSRCTGIFRVYLELYGGDEFQPISRDALAALDPERRNFVLLVDPLLAPLRAALAANDMPPSWSLQQEISEDRLRRVEMIFAHDDGASLRLRFVAPGCGRAAVIRCAAYDVDAEADLPVPVDAVATLLAWVRARLAAGVDASDAPTLAPDAVERALRDAVLVRGQQRVMLLARRLQSRFHLPGWHLEPLRWPTPIVGEMVAGGQAGLHVKLCFTLGMRANRSQVGVDFRLPDECDQSSLKPVVDELVTLLREARPAAGAAASALAVAAP